MQGVRKLNKWIIMLIVSAIIGAAGLAGMVYHVLTYPGVIHPIGIVYSLLLALGFIAAGTSFNLYRASRPSRAVPA